MRKQPTRSRVAFFELRTPNESPHFKLSSAILMTLKALSKLELRAFEVLTCTQTN